MSEVPLVSCICLTYNRPPAHEWLVEEALKSFLVQDYPRKELIILSDCPGQFLSFQSPDVLVVNVNRRFHSLGEKLNAAVGLARGDFIALWDDDDISLPWRIPLSIQAIGDADYYNPSQYWFIDSEGLHIDHAMGLAHHCSILSRRAFDFVGGYPHSSGAQDLEMDRRLREHPDVQIATREPLDPAHWYYIYRWGVSAVHLSGRLPHDEWYEQIGEFPIRPGTYHLNPWWREDYVAKVRSAPGARSDPGPPTRVSSATPREGISQWPA